MEVNDQQVTVNVLDTMKSPDDVKDYNIISVMNFAEAERLNSCYSNEEFKAAIFEELEDEDLKTVNII